MPTDKAPAASNAPKRVRTESARKREGRENAETLKRERTGQKAAAKARKNLRDEAADDGLLVEHEGESPDFLKLRVYALKLESDNQRMKAKLARREEQADTPPVKVIPMPAAKGTIDIALLRHHLDMSDEDSDLQWSMIRHDFRALLVAAGLDWDRPWSRQDFDRVNTLFHAVENRRPEMKRFANHWGTEFLLKECFGNIYSYHQKQAQLKNGNSTSSDSTKRAPRRDDSPSDARDDDKPDPKAPKDNARKAAAHKAAAYRAAERKAAKRKADTQDVDKDDNDRDDDGTPYNDGETEIEDLTPETREAIERDEIGVPSKSELSAKTTPKPHRPHPRNSDAPTSENTEAPTASTASPKPRIGVSNPEPGLKPRPVIYLKRGHGPGGKARRGGYGGGGGRALAPVANVPSAAPSPRDDDVISTSSGQTTSESDED